MVGELIEPIIKNFESYRFVYEDYFKKNESLTTVTNRYYCGVIDKKEGTCLCSISMVDHLHKSTAKKLLK